MRIERGTDRVLSGPLETVYVYEAPVRVWHWVMALCMVVLAATGYLIGRPLPAIGGEAYSSYFFAMIRMLHFIAAWIFTIVFVMRIYWAIVGNHHARAIFLPPFFNRAWWRGMVQQMRYYLFMREESDLWIGHNPLAQASMFFMYTLGTFLIIITGFALFAEQWGWGTLPMRLFGWVFVLAGDASTVRTVHHLAMWYLLLFALVHMYMVVREDIMGGETEIGTMFSGIRMFRGRTWRDPEAPAAAEGEAIGKRTA